MDINIGFEKVEKILHIADVHIRNYKRHKEYRQVFRKLYKEAKLLPKNSLIYVAGDIVHTKTDISPELVQIVSEFLNKLANIRPTIVIAGNHDANLNNRSRLDSLTPIIENLDNPNLHYLRDSGIYSAADVDFIVYSILEEPDSWPKPKDSKSKNKIGVFHGAVNNSKTDAGYTVRDENLPLKTFDGCHMVMLGDIHKFQYLNKGETVAYAGSLIQQNFGETFENHGYVIWDIKTRKSEFFNIHNDYGYYTLRVKDGILPNIDNIPKYPRLRFITENTTQAQVKELLIDIRKKCSVHDFVVIKGDKLSNTSNNSRGSTEITKDIRDSEYQNKLIKEHLERNFPIIDESILKRVGNINRDLNKLLPDVEIGRNISWKPKVFEFSNMFSYGENNIIDFNNMKGAVGIFAPNHAGKSAILDALAYCIFDKCSRTKMAAAVINNKKNNFTCKLNFEIDGVDYFIERKGKRKKDGGARVDVDFWMIGEDGNPISLNGDQRVYTNKNIRGYLGNYDDFALTALSVQNNNTGFIDKTQTEKKDLLAQFLDISVFEELYSYANEEIKDVQVLLKDFKNTDFSHKLHEETILKDELTIEYSNIDQEKSILLKSEKAANKKIIEYTSKIIQLDPEVPESVEALESDAKQLVINLSTEKSKLEKYEKYTEENKSEFYKLAKILKTYNRKNLEADYTRNGQVEKLLQKLNHEIEMMKVKVKNKLDTVNQLHTHEYDPDCEYCSDNSFVKNAETARQELPKLKLETEKLLETKSNLELELSSLKQSVIKSNELTELDSKISLIKQYQSEIKVKTVTRKANIDSKKVLQKSINMSIDKYYENKRSIISNIKINEKINLKDAELDIIKDNLSTTNSKLQTAYSNISVCQKTIENILESIERAHDLEERLKAYEYYLIAIQRDGVPYELISQILPYVEEEVNMILSQITDFSIQFETDGRNINTFIVYSDSEKWALEMTSGMEKFVSSLAIRVALINVSNLPRPNFLAIDEGFGNLDAGNLNSIFSLFDYLKLNFDFIVVISHIDLMKDATDNILEITQTKGYSQVMY
jgi:DNA repair exonuclease SbcCD ATPase subunit